jgi:hypothetical protein
VPKKFSLKAAWILAETINSKQQLKARHWKNSDLKMATYFSTDLELGD